MTKAKGRRLISLFLCLIFTFTNLFLVQAFASVKDINGNFAEKQINRWIEKGYVSPYKDGTFKPDAGITRADLAKIINKSFGFSAMGKSNFKDVKKNDAFFKDFAIAKNAKYYLSGTNGIIKPKGIMSRQEFAYAMYQVMGLEKPEKTVVTDAYTDTVQINTEYRYAVEAMANLGLMTGNAENDFLPTSIVTRAEAIEILDNCISYYKLTFHKAGTYSEKIVRGSVMIGAADVVVENTIIQGNLLIDQTVGNGSVTLNKVTVIGDTIINGGGTNSIILNDCKLLKVFLPKEDYLDRIIKKGTTGDVIIEIRTPTPPLSNDATIKTTSTIKGQTIDRLGTPSADLENVVPGSITLAYDKSVGISDSSSFITLFEKNEAGAYMKVVKYSKTEVPTNFYKAVAYNNQEIKDQDYFLIGITAANKITKLYYKILVNIKPIQIPSFDSLDNVAGGMVGKPTYNSTSAVIAALPKTLKAGSGAISVPVKTWTNTDNYNGSKVGSYTFTAVLGDLPYGYTNEKGYTSSVEVIMAPSGEIYSNTSIAYFDENPGVAVVLLKDTFDMSNTTTSMNYWNVSVGSTGLTFSAVNAAGTGANLYFTGIAKEGTITIQAKDTILMGGVQSNTIKIVIPGPTKITRFDRIPKVNAGIAGNTIYKDAAAVIDSLPKTVTANGNAVTIPVTTWQNTDGYNPGVAGSYTFTASLGVIPGKFINYYGYSMTVEVVVNPPSAFK